MRDTTGAECEISLELIAERLAHAFLTIRKLPNDSRQRLRIATYGYVSELSKDDKPGPIRIAATAMDIALMDEALAWPSMIDSLTARRAVQARSMVHPATERPIYPWNRLARAMGADARAVKRWHAEGLRDIQAKLYQAGQ